MSSASTYVLGSDDAEIARLDAQAAKIADATRLLLQAAGIGPGMRVLDLGTGLGHVALAVAELVGESGSVLGIDQAEPLLAVAERRRVAAGRDNMRLIRADARTYRDDAPFDAVVSRLLLFHLPDVVDVLRHHGAALRPGGLMVALDFDLGTSRSEPPLPLVATALGWIEAAFRSAGADPRIGARLGVHLRDAGFADVAGFGLQNYFAPDAPDGPAQLTGVIRTLAPAILAAGIASEAELGLDTLEQRIAHECAAARATILPPGLAGAWARRA
jgi:SAM-dependent methyltransferase